MSGKSQVVWEEREQVKLLLLVCDDGTIEIYYHWGLDEDLYCWDGTQPCRRRPCPRRGRKKEGAKVGSGEVMEETEEEINNFTVANSDEMSFEALLA